jgi:hypothetical protein
LKLDTDRIVRLKRVAIRTGQHPAGWKQASGVLIGKPGKDDYTKLQAYPSISLLSGRGKVVEKVASELMSEVGD